MKELPEAVRRHAFHLPLSWHQMFTISVTIVNLALLISTTILVNISSATVECGDLVGMLSELTLFPDSDSCIRCKNNVL